MRLALLLSWPTLQESHTTPASVDASKAKIAKRVDNYLGGQWHALGQPVLAVDGVVVRF